MKNSIFKNVLKQCFVIVFVMCSISNAANYTHSLEEDDLEIRFSEECTLDSGFSSVIPTPTTVGKSSPRSSSGTRSFRAFSAISPSFGSAKTTPVISGRFLDSARVADSHEWLEDDAFDRDGESVLFDANFDSTEENMFFIGGNNGLFASRELKLEEEALSHVYNKHAEHFGLNKSAKQRGSFEHLDSLEQILYEHIWSCYPIKGTYRGNPATHYFDRDSKRNVVVGSDGYLIAAFKLSPRQEQHVLMTGDLK